MQSLAAWVATPVALLAIAYGLGALAALLARVSPPPALLAPLGAGAAVAISLTGYVVGLRGAADAADARRARRRRVGARRAAPARAPAPRPRRRRVGGHVRALPGAGRPHRALDLAGLQLRQRHLGAAAARRLAPRPRARPGGRGGGSRRRSTSSASYIDTGYPLGSHALLAAIDAVVPVRAEVLYQPFIAVFGGARGGRAGRARPPPRRGPRGPRWPASRAMASNLLYQYALQGNMKEIVTAAMIATIAGTAAGWSRGRARGGGARREGPAAHRRRRPGRRRRPPPPSTC